ncbi:MAG: thioredoxin family protein [Acidobacteria bacterium]|nr:thioredoxin family protein [Acidobacteriota bacterium]
MAGKRLSQRSVPLGLLAAAVAVVLIRIAVPEPTVTTLVAWVPLARADAVASQQGKPILYDFTADWCVPCRSLDREGWANADVALIVNREFVPVRVDASARDEDLDPAVLALKKRYRVEAFPTLVVTDAEGKELRRESGFRNRALLTRFLQSRQ